MTLPSRQAADLLVAGCDRAALTRKLGDPASPLAPWWRHFTALARQDGEWYAEYAVLLALVTDAAADRARAVTALMRLVDLKAAGDTSQDAQFHTHVTEAPLARWAIWTDWALDQGWLDAVARDALRAAMLEHAATFALPHLQSRHREFDNQILSNAIGAAAVGYVWGLHHGDDPLGRTLYDAGMARLRTLFALVPAGGYSYEGSAYQLGVVAPLIAIAGQFYQEMTGVDVFRAGVRDGAVQGPPLLKVLALSWQILGPNGLAPGWDDYGFKRATDLCALVMLARLSGDPGPLATLRGLHMWYRNSLPAWGHDDRVWSLLWWPEALDAAGGTAAADASWPAWMEPTVGGALQDAATGTRLVQVWDRCGGVGQSGRCQVDPNTVTLEAYGTPLVLDGHLDLTEAQAPVPIDTVLGLYDRAIFTSWQDYARVCWNWDMPLETAVRRGMAGSLAYANTLIFDDEDWWVPRDPTQGQGQALHAVGPLQALRADAVAYYAGRYPDLQAVTRSSLLVDGRYLLVCDRVQGGDAAHTITWQAYLRAGAVATGPRSLRIATPERVGCDVVFAQDGELVLTPIPGQPKAPADGSTRVRYRIATPAAADAAAAAFTARLDVALLPQTDLAPLADLSAGWTRTYGAQRDMVSLQDHWLTDDATAPDTPRVFTRTVELDAADLARGLYLELADGGPDLTLTVNGESVNPLLPVQPPGHWRSTGAVPLTYDLRPHLRAGANTLRFTAPWFHGETLAGPCRLLATQPTRAATVTRTGADSFTVRCGAGEDAVLMDRVDGLAPWAGGETDARYALALQDGRVAAAAVSRLHLPGRLRLHGQGPCDLAWEAASSTLANLTPGARVTLSWGDAALAVEAGGTLRVAWQGPTAHTLRLTLDAPTRVWLNGEDRGAMSGSIALALPPTAAPTPAPLLTPAAVYALLDRAPLPSPAVASALLAALRADDWRLQCAAAEACGRLEVTAAAAPLLALFRAEGADLQYPALTHWWTFSRMYRNPDAQVGHDPSLPEPAATKRWRLRMAVVGALGRLGAVEALPDLETALAAGRDFFPVMAELAVAIGRLGQASSLPLLEHQREHAEANTRSQVNAALAYIAGGARDRATFERAIR